MTRSWKILPLRLKVLAAIIVVGVIPVAIVPFRIAGAIKDRIAVADMSSNALFVDSFLKANLQVRATNTPVSNDQQRARAERPNISFRIWTDDMIAYSNRRELIAKKFPTTRARQRAVGGQLDGNVDGLSGADNIAEREGGLLIFETSTPTLQEALTKSYRHPRGLGWFFAGTLVTSSIAVEARDRRDGRGKAVASLGPSGGHVLLGMCQRIEGHGGASRIASGHGSRTVLTARFDVRSEGLSRWVT